MKHRVSIDESFKSESDAKTLTDFARQMLSKSANVKEGLADERINFCSKHLCGHDEGKKCSDWEREELMCDKVVTVRSIE